MLTVLVKAGKSHVSAVIFFQFSVQANKAMFFQFLFVYFEFLCE